VGLKNLPHSEFFEVLEPAVISAHVTAFEVTFAVSAGIALLGALVTLVLVRKTDRLAGPVFGRRSRWVFASQGRSSAITKRPESSI
jgi:hypothetical protein